MAETGKPLEQQIKELQNYIKSGKLLNDVLYTETDWQDLQKVKISGLKPLKKKNCKKSKHH